MAANPQARLLLQIGLFIQLPTQVLRVHGSREGDYLDSLSFEKAWSWKTALEYGYIAKGTRCRVRRSLNFGGLRICMTHMATMPSAGGPSISVSLVEGVSGGFD